MHSQRQVSFVLTSCNRFDLLEKTLESFFQFNTYPIAQYIIIEDSHNVEKLQAVLARFPKVNFTVLHNDPQLGQMKSIERAYDCVTSDYIFHCEDDWEFYRKGFIEDSFAVLDSDEKIVTVWLREQNDTNDHGIDPEVLPCTAPNARPYQLLTQRHKRTEKSLEWHGFTLNPGLRRLKDYQLIAPMGQYQSEKAIDQVYYEHGFKAAIFETGYVRHLGFHRGIRYQINQSAWCKDFSVAYRRIKAKICQWLGL